MASNRWPPKDPDALLDYPVSWGEWLIPLGDTLASVTWILPDELNNEIQINDDYIATIWLSGGTAGETHAVTCRVTTAGGRIDDRTFYLPIKER